MDALTPPSPATPGPRLRVCHVASTVRAIWMMEQLQGLRDLYAWDASCLTAGPEGSVHERLRQAGIPFRLVSLDLHMLPCPWTLLPEIFAMAALFRRERFDVVQTSLWHSMLVGRLAGWLADVPVRLALVVGPFHLDAPITRWIDAATWWMESRLIGACRYIRDVYASFGASDRRLDVIYLGIDETRFDPDTASVHDLRVEYGWPADTPVIVHVAWFYMRVGASRWAPPACWGRASKGHDDLIRATPHILREFPNARVVLIGSGWHDAGTQYMREMIALVEQLRLQEHVIFAGARTNIASIYRASDVAVHPSVTEACGGTLESLLMARPTVATRVGGMPDLVIDGQTGLLVNPADPEDLARGICALLREPDRARSLAMNGRAHALRIATLGRTLAELDALYRDALFPNGRRRAGYRWWVSLARLPVVVAVVFYLNARYIVLETKYLPKWLAGWRPWHPRALAALPFELLALPFVVLAPRSWALGLRRTYHARRLGLRRAYHALRRRLGLRRAYHALRRRLGSDR